MHARTRINGVKRARTDTRSDTNACTQTHTHTHVCLRADAVRAHSIKYESCGGNVRNAAPTARRRRGPTKCVKGV